MKIEMRALEQLLPSDHAARVVWEFVRKLDLSEFYADIKAVEGRPGQPPVDPAILLALWLLATIEGVGSARELARLSTAHIAYEWLCGEVGVNHHLLSDFRSAHPERLEKLLVQVLASLMNQGLVTLTRVAQDGMRVRASAGGSSFRRKPKLQEHLRDAQAQVEALKNQVDEDAGAADRRAKSAKERAAQERLARVEEALAQLPELEAKRERRKKGDGETVRCSTTDPDVRRMKMADGGTRPAYNPPAADLQRATGHDRRNAADRRLGCDQRRRGRRPDDTDGRTTRHALPAASAGLSRGRRLLVEAGHRRTGVSRHDGLHAGEGREPEAGERPRPVRASAGRLADDRHVATTDGNSRGSSVVQTPAEPGGIPERRVPQPRPATIPGPRLEESESRDALASAGLQPDSPANAGLAAPVLKNYGTRSEECLNPVLKTPPTSETTHPLRTQPSTPSSFNDRFSFYFKNNHSLSAWERAS